MLLEYLGDSYAACCWLLVLLVVLGLVL